MSKIDPHALQQDHRLLQRALGGCLLYSFMEMGISPALLLMSLQTFATKANQMQVCRVICDKQGGKRVAACRGVVREAPGGARGLQEVEWVAKGKPLPGSIAIEGVNHTIAAGAEYGDFYRWLPHMLTDGAVKLAAVHAPLPAHQCLAEISANQRFVLQVVVLMR